MEKIDNIIQYFEKNSIKIYLIFINIILIIFCIWFFNIGVLPLKNPVDFLFLTLMVLLLALYRPGWAFTLFIGSLGIDNINIAPESFKVAIRPYQLLALVIFLALISRYLLKKMPFKLSKMVVFDILPIIFILSSLVSAILSENKGIAMKQTLVAISFVAIYFLVRIFIQNFEDLKKIMPFIFSSAIVIAAYSIFQNIRFKLGLSSFEVMPARPNATFTEPDWLGIYFVFISATILSIIYYKNKKIVLLNFKNFVNVNLINYIFLILIFVPLILTVSRSAWIGIFFTILAFLSIIFFDKSLEISLLKFRYLLFSSITIIFAIIISILIVYVFSLTTFKIGERTVSTAGLQKITISCNSDLKIEIPKTIKEMKEIDPCRHINLEDVEKEKNAGNNIFEIYRPDPNIGIRSKIYAISFLEIKNNPIFGIGMGNISTILGNDQRGEGLNSSNIFLETWLGTGIFGLLAFVLLLGYILIKSIILFFSKNETIKKSSVFVILSFVSIMIPNMFNAGIFLSFLWVFFALAISLIDNKNKTI